MHPTDPAGFEIYLPEEQARARALPTAALVAALAERGEPGDIPGDQLGELLSLAEQEQAHPAREVVILRALAAHKLPCGHGLDDIVYGGPDLNGLPAVAQCGQCLADRQTAKAALPRTPETVLRAMLRAYEKAALDAFAAFYRVCEGDSVARETARVNSTVLDRDVVALRSVCAWVLAGHALDMGFSHLRADYEARLAGTRPLDAPPPEAP